MTQVEELPLRPILVVVNFGVVLVLETVSVNVGRLLKHPERGQLALSLSVLEVTLPTHGLLLCLLDHGLHLDLISRELAPPCVHQEAVGLVQEKVLPLVEVLLVAIPEVVSEVVLAEVNVVVGLVELTKYFAIQNRQQEILHFVSVHVSEIDALMLLFYSSYVLVEGVEKLGLVVLEAVDRLLLFELLGFLKRCLLILPFFLLLKILFGLFLGSLDVFLLLLDPLLVLFLHLLLDSLGLFERFPRHFHLLVGSLQKRVVGRLLPFTLFAVRIVGLLFWFWGINFLGLG